MNSIIIDESVCKGCRLCTAVCPAAAIAEGSVRNSMGYLIPLPDPQKCRGCASCEYICPDMAITVEKKQKGAGGHA